MAKFIVFLIVIVLAVIGVGYYLGWFNVATSHTAEKTKVEVTVDKEKIKKDEEKAKEKLKEAGHQLKEEVDKAVDKTKKDTKSAPGGQK